MDSAFVGGAVGLVIIFGILASLATAATEAIARFIGLRAEYLLRGIRTLLVADNTFKLPVRNPPKDSVDKAPADNAARPEGFSETVKAVLESPLIAASGPQKTIMAGNAALSRKERRSLPSYISSSAFSAALLDTLVPADGDTPLQKLENAIERSDFDDRTKKLLATLAKQADGDINRLRTSLEATYDSHMQRVSGWYKRHVRWITLVVGALLVLILNLNATRIASSLYLDEPLRTAVTAQAQSPTNCDDKDPNACLHKVLDAVEPLSAAGLPLGWKAVPQCLAGTHCSWLDRYGITDPSRGDAWHNTWHALGALLGYLVMILAVLPGARFWFSALSKLNIFRASGSAPATVTAT
ncbi:MAG: hypothetical protein JWN96_3230 [Mycobacterium sp.]|nr:hypothetical protein [Mycobacterium sp.]